MQIRHLAAIAFLICSLASLNSSSVVSRAQVAAPPATADPTDSFSPELREAMRLAEAADVVELEAKVDNDIKATRRSLEEKEKQLGPNDPLVGEVSLTLAILYTLDRDFVRAEKSLKRARVIYEKAYGVEDVRYSYVLAASANWELEKGIEDKVENWLEQILAIREKALGPDHLATAEAVFQLAEFHQTWRDYAEASALYQRALAIRNKHLAAEDSRVTQIWARQACLMRKQHKETEAAELEYRAGVGPKPEYEKNGKYKTPVRGPLDRKVRKWGYVTHMPLPFTRQPPEYFGVHVAIDPSGRVMYSCSGADSGAPNSIYLVEHAIYRTAFNPTTKKGSPVPAYGYLGFIRPGREMTPLPNPLNPPQ